MKLVPGPDGKPWVEIEFRGRKERFQPQEVDEMGPVTRRDYGLDDWGEGAAYECLGTAAPGGGKQVRFQGDAEGMEEEPPTETPMSSQRRRQGWLHLRPDDEDGED
jgi:hypothetical protein